MHSGSDKPKVLFRINDEVLVQLKHPFGQLVLGSPEKTIPIVAKTILDEKPKKVIAVGDIVATNMCKASLVIDIIIVDGKTMRGGTAECVERGHLLTVRNPPGEISQEAYDALRSTIRGNHIGTVFVQGEEDLLALPLVTLAPIGSLIVYGQPLVGLVMVRVTSSAKREARRILSLMRVKQLEKG